MLECYILIDLMLHTSTEEIAKILKILLLI